MQVPGEFVAQGSPHGATLNLTLKEDHFTPKGEFRLQCSGGVSDQYFISTRIVNIRRMIDHNLSDSSSNKWKLYPRLVLTACFVLYIIN